LGIYLRQLTANKNLSKQTGALSATSVTSSMKNGKCKVKGIILDLDGTIVDSRKAYREAAETTFKTLGRIMTDRKVVTEIPKRMEQNLPIDDLLQDMDEPRFLRAYLKAYYKATSTKTEPIPDVAKALEKLSKKTILVLMTRRHVPKKEVIEQLERFGLAKHFQKIITAKGNMKPKPSPEGLLSCLKQLRIETCECWVVGDSVVDIRAGKNAGVKTVAVLSGIFTREELEKEKPDLILKNVSELADFLT
jgi:HAD superfamily hydrolase (TIGR01509 family)